jgi:nucleotide-binding universal stress UspA family protein
MARRTREQLWLVHILAEHIPAERLGVDVACLGSRGESGIKVLLGSVAAAVLRESTRPVVVVCPPPA